MSHPYEERFTWTGHTRSLAEKYRSGLHAAGFLSPRLPDVPLPMPNPRNQIRFFRQDTALTAFFVNLEPCGEDLRIYYGCASTAYTRMKGDEESLLNWGFNESNSCLRFSIIIRSPEDEPLAARQIGDMIRQYTGTEKDALLTVIKEQRRAWLDRITRRLKPLGFRKKGNEWRKVLPSGFTLYFWAEKGSYGDSYNFPVALSSPYPHHDYCLTATIEPSGEMAPDPYCHHAFDWQINTIEDLTQILDLFLREYEHPLTMGPIDPLLPKLHCARKDCPAADCPLRSGR